MKQPKRQALMTTEPNFNKTEKADLRFLTTRLSALCETSEKPLNEIERNAIFGMISYVAHTQNVEEGVVGEVVTAHFGVSAVAALPSRLYQHAIEYLVDLKMDKVVN